MYLLFVSEGLIVFLSVIYLKGQCQVILTQVVFSLTHLEPIFQMLKYFLILFLFTEIFSCATTSQSHLKTLSQILYLCSDICSHLLHCRFEFYMFPTKEYTYISKSTDSTPCVFQTNAHPTSPRLLCQTETVR